GFEGPVVIQYGSETDVLIRLQGKPEQGLSEKVYGVLEDGSEAVELRRVDFVGPQIGEELREDGGLGMLTALAVVMLYVAIRFQLKFSIGAVLALAHDVIITLGFFSITGLEFDLTVLAAILAVVGYSLNDTIVVSDRIRENFRKIRKATPVEVINESLSQTLWRTINTSVTTMLVLLALFFIGGELIHNFAVALMVGVGIGTYSSIYVAATVMLLLKVDREDLLEPVEGELVDDLP
ncbi:protein translocase subunit SecF, partial [Porticoccaceae bacterium]|nr:protein translocase subunit SecF [Porticoccaceae bacterium]